MAFLQSCFDKYPSCSCAPERVLKTKSAQITYSPQKAISYIVAALVPSMALLHYNAFNNSSFSNTQVWFKLNTLNMFNINQILTKSKAKLTPLSFEMHKMAYVSKAHLLIQDSAVINVYWETLDLSQLLSRTLISLLLISVCF